MSERKDTHLTWHMEPAQTAITFSGRVNILDLASLRLDPIDRMLLREPMVAAEDVLQTLETIFRRIAQQRAASGD